MNTDVKQYHESLEPERGQICDELHSIINDHLEGSTNKVWHGAPVWFIDENPIVGYWSRKNEVRLLFWSGQSFEEPGLQPEGKFKAAEAYYSNVSDINETDIIRWLQKSRSIQWDYKNIVKNRGVLERLK